MTVSIPITPDNDLGEEPAAVVAGGDRFALIARAILGYTIGSRRVRVLVVSADAYSRVHPVIVLIHDRADGDVPGILVPLPGDLAGGGTIDLSRIRFADPAAFGHRHGWITPTVAAKVDQGLRRLLGLK